MSDTEVVACLDEMEARLHCPSSDWTPEALEGWHQRFHAAVATAERGPDWAEIVERAHSLGGMVTNLAALASSQRDQIRMELDRQALGYRALKGYGASVR